MSVETRGLPCAVKPRRPRVRAHVPNALGLVLSTRTATEAAQGALADRLRVATLDSAASEEIAAPGEHDPGHRAAAAHVRLVGADDARREIVRDGDAR